MEISKEKGDYPRWFDQWKRQSFYFKFPNLERGVKQNNDGSASSLGVGGDGVPNDVPNVKQMANLNPESEDRTN